MQKARRYWDTNRGRQYVPCNTTTPLLAETTRPHPRDIVNPRLGWEGNRMLCFTKVKREQGETEGSFVDVW